MFSLDRWREIGATLVENKLRTVLTTVAMSWGIFMLVVLLGVGNGLEHGAASGFAGSATNSIWIFGGQTSVPHNGMPIGRRIFFDNQDVALAAARPEVDHWTGRFRITNDGADLRVRVGAKVSSFPVRAVHPGDQAVELLTIVLGRFVNESDVARRSKVCVVGVPVAEFLFGKEEVIGNWVEINGVAFQIVGVYDEGPPDLRRRILIPITTAQAAWTGADRVHMVAFTVGDLDVEATQALTEALGRQIAAHHDYDAADPQAARVQNNVENYANFQRIFTMLHIFVWLMGGCTIVAGVVGVSNIMMIVVRERTKEIGIRKALGATPWNIVGTIVQESVVLTAAAGYLGMVAGVAALQLIARVMPATDMFKDPEVDLGVAAAATLVLVTAGVVAGFFPARAAARVNPIVALRDE
jgi:putative ABC transport system permease protein